jgi:hypothetical protein
VVTAKTKVPSEVPAVSSVVSQKVEAEVLLSEVTPDVESTLTEAERQANKKRIATHLQNILRVQEDSTTTYNSHIKELKSKLGCSNNFLNSLPAPQDIRCRAPLIAEAVSELKLAYEKAEDEDEYSYCRHVERYNVLVAELENLDNKKAAFIHKKIVKNVKRR